MRFSVLAESPGVCIERRSHWLRVRFDDDHDLLGFPILGGVRTQGKTVLWHEVSNRELPVDVDPRALLEQRILAIGEKIGPTFLTSRSLRHVHVKEVRYGDVHVVAVATVGLGNALRVGDSPGECRTVGTINVLCRVSVPLTEAAMLETLAVAVEARTVAIGQTELRSRRSGAPASGTGTDCLIIAAKVGENPLPFAGKHTDVGHAAGLAVREAVTEGALVWKESYAWS